LSEVTRNVSRAYEWRVKEEDWSTYGSQHSRVLLILGSIRNKPPSSINANVLAVEPLVLHHVNHGVNDLLGRDRQPRESGMGGEIVLAEREVSSVRKGVSRRPGREAERGGAYK
jgi:hypothetical protein